MPIHISGKVLTQIARSSSTHSLRRSRIPRSTNLGLWHKFVLAQAAACRRDKAQCLQKEQAFFLRLAEQIMNSSKEQRKEDAQKHEEELKNLQKENKELATENDNLKMELRRVETQFMKYHEIFELRGALEGILKEAERQEVIRPTKYGKQAALNELSKHARFTKILKSESKARKLEEDIIQSQISFLFKLYSAYAHGHEDNIVIRVADHPPYRRAALVALLKLQDQWPYPIKWLEEKSKGSGKWGF